MPHKLNCEQKYIYMKKAPNQDKKQTSWDEVNTFAHKYGFTADEVRAAKLKVGSSTEKILAELKKSADPAPDVDNESGIG